MEQLAVDGNDAWNDNLAKLADYTELRLVSKIAGVELRLSLICKYYKGQRELIASILDEIPKLRRCLAITPDKLPQGESRNVAILRLTNKLAGILLDANYRYSERGRRTSKWVGVGVATLIVLIGSGAFAFFDG